jgi:hypothetical protein
MLVNEAIIDVGIGMAKFQREYYAGFMPKVGCPRCNGYTMCHRLRENVGESAI